MMMLKGVIENKGILALLFSVPRGNSKLLQSSVAIPFQNAYEGRSVKIHKGLGETGKSC